MTQIPNRMQKIRTYYNDGVTVNEHRHQLWWINSNIKLENGFQEKEPVDWRKSNRSQVSPFIQWQYSMMDKTHDYHNWMQDVSDESMF